MLNTINVAQTALTSAQTQVENVMNNIANENTDGYKKRVVDTKELDHSDSRVTGRGVYVYGVNRITNMYVYDNLIDHQSKNFQHNELSSMLSNIEAIFFETDDSGLSADLDNYFQAVEDLRANPNNEIYRNNLKNSGKILVNDLKNMYENLEKQEASLKNRVNDNLDEVNGLLKNIGIVNKQIINATGDTNALEDERDLLESKLSQYVDIKVSRVDGYSLSIGGVTAVRYDTNVHDLKLVTNHIAQKDVYADVNNTSTLVNPATWDGDDSITYYFNKENSIKISVGDTFVDSKGDTQTVSKDNIVQALVSKINEDPKLSLLVEAHNGQYSVDENGDKHEFEPTTSDHYLVIESKTSGIAGKFDGQIIVNDDDNLNTNSEQVSNIVKKSDIKSDIATNDVHIEIYESELTVSSGRLKSMLDNLDTTSSENKFTNYKSMLNDFAKALSDFTDGYIEKGKLKYASGEQASLLDHNKENMQMVGLFEGTSVANLEFKESVVDNLSQNDLEYLATMQWNDKVMIGSSNEPTSFSKYYASVRAIVSDDKENVDYMSKTQKAVTQSLAFNYDKMTKVNKDDELINLVKYQSAYEANAKLVTIVDEMLSTILGMRR